MVSLNLSEQPNFIRPELLLHPTIPRSLSGVNPRRLKGKEWWDETRKAAYALNNYCCWACGVHKLDTKEQLLDGHETYEYDFGPCIAHYAGTVALCRSCHQFIHFDQIVWLAWRIRVLLRGLRILKSAGLKPPYAQTVAAAYLGYGKMPRRKRREEVKVRSLGFTYWQLEFDGKVFDILGEVKE